MSRFVTTPATRGETRGRLCPQCSGGSRVIDVIHSSIESRRRRECRVCRYRWTTRERDDKQSPPTGAVENR